MVLETMVLRARQPGLDLAGRKNQVAGRVGDRLGLCCGVVLSRE